ncbi:hypothetical protein [Planctomicrobium piriforme]|uniref:Uncharacterized protein n=1 Tax=Planctomicrobium piriforme TaxID=1576369 RepID=A0A1I3EE99_9PLAN|nr:hypothetical protein [Planctomicrobium piriforme]SFH97300.1 hypothetical protein SAMN05421753_104186 [Planctomicrobium piriforme]
MRQFLTFATVLFLLPCMAFAQATSVIKGPEKASPGDLIILDGSSSDCDSLVWILANSDKAFLPVESNQKCVFASGESAPYTFLLATAKTVDGKSSIAVSKHTVQVGTPTPGPGPGPVPPPPTPGPTLTGLQLSAYNAAKLVNRKSGEATKLADALQNSASQAAALGWTLDKLKSEFATASRATVIIDDDAKSRWTSFQQFFVATMSPVTDISKAVGAFDDIAIGLRAVDAKAASVPAATDASNETLKGTIQGIQQELNGIKGFIGN